MKGSMILNLKHVLVDKKYREICNCTFVLAIHIRVDYKKIAGILLAFVAPGP